MIKKLFLAGAVLAAATQVQAGQNYNYSYIQAYAGQEYMEFSGGEFNGYSYGLEGQYELSMVPLILKASLRQGSFENDLPRGWDWDFSAYSFGADFVISASDRLDLLPGLAVSTLTDKARDQIGTYDNEVTAYTGSLKARYHLEEGLWLGGFVAHDSFKNKDINLFLTGSRTHRNLDNQTYFGLEAEYVVDDGWAFGFSHINRADEGNTRFMIKVFY